MSTDQAVLAIAVMAAVTIALRFAPFLILAGRPTPKVILYLGRVLPYAIMGMLVVYCLRDMSFTSAAGFIPELAAGAVVVVCHVLRRSTLLSILAGTVCYMLLVQLVF